ncbi:hypothetical protein DL769_004866 [Monosporascus sp. CRB-8-3]|nr:hypothetical protein DL769_004866 [Monosporascus sp. CRB-8-3]
MSAFGAKRKARKITVQEDDEDTGLRAPIDLEPEPQQEPALQATFKTRKPFKQSSLRKTININDDEPAQDAAPPKPGDEAEDDNEDGGAPLRVRPALGGRSASTKAKKRASTASRLSFGPSEAGGNAGGDEDSLMLGGESFTPKKASSSSLAQEAAENSAYKRGRARNLPLGGLLPLRSSADTDRLYSKEYLSELQNSTPNTPQNLSTADDEMSLDPSELEGAMVVDSGTGQEIAPPPPPPHQTEILTEAQIQEKKERRARLAKAQGNDDFISLSDDDIGDQRRAGDSYLAVLSRRSDDIRPAPRSEATRLVREDEDLGEGFEAFVEDGGLSLGAKAEREARRKQRAQMASLIEAAEGGASVEDEISDDSEAERRAAYEAAQTRKGMDGLKAAKRTLGDSTKEGVVPVPHRIAPLPDLSVLLDEFRGRVQRRKDEVARARARIAELRAERHEVARREPEVQRLLDEAGERYRALVMPGPTGSAAGGAAAGNGAEGNGGVGGEAGANGDEDGDGNAAAERARSLLDQVRRDGPPGTPGERGLESLGTTPVRPSRTEET